MSRLSLLGLTLSGIRKLYKALFKWFQIKQVYQFKWSKTSALKLYITTHQHIKNLTGYSPLRNQITNLRLLNTRHYFIYFYNLLINNFRMFVHKRIKFYVYLVGYKIINHTFNRRKSFRFNRQQFFTLPRHS